MGLGGLTFFQLWAGVIWQKVRRVEGCGGGWSCVPAQQSWQQFCGSVQEGHSLILQLHGNRLVVVCRKATAYCCSHWKPVCVSWEEGPSLLLLWSAFQ